MNSYRENVFFHYILNNLTFLSSTRPEFFSNDLLREIFSLAKDHTLKYKEPPSKDQLLELVRMKGLDNINEDILTALWNSKSELGEYTSEWLDENAGTWIRVRNLDYVTRKAITFMKMTTITPENATEVIDKVRHIMSTETAIDFSFDLGGDFFDPETHRQSKLERSSSGYPFIDLCLAGGYWKGSLIVFLGGPKTGKSMWLGNLAAHSVWNGHNTAYITLELQKEIISMRIGSNMLNIPSEEYSIRSEDGDFMKKKLASLQRESFKELGKFHVKGFPSSTLSANDLRAYLLKSQDLLGYKFENIFIDYINIMKNWRNPNSENLYIKIKQISEDLRALAQEEKWTIITATQTNRDGWDRTDLSNSNVSESAALLHTVDGLFGIITDPIMKARGEYFLKYLADRVSGMENTRKKFLFNKSYFRIEEDVNSQIEDMDTIFTSRRRGEGLHATISTRANESGVIELPDERGGNSELFK